MRPIRAFLIAGPTASGKSALAIEVARRLNGVVVNADSMQVYADLRILNARPTAADEARVAHSLYGHIDGATNYSVGLWLKDVARVLAELTAAGRPAIFTGGTGLYFKALTQGLSDMPEAPAAVRAQIRAEAQGVTPAQLHARLAAIDPKTAQRLRPSDPQRILRALEIFIATGRPLADFQHLRQQPLLAAGQWRGLFLAPPREETRAAIDRRFEQMMASGALEEIAQLDARRLDPALPIMRAHGVPHLLAFLRGDLSREAAVVRAQADTRAYAKRQETFARHQLPELDWTRPEAAITKFEKSWAASPVQA